MFERRSIREYHGQAEGNCNQFIQHKQKGQEGNLSGCDCCFPRTLTLLHFMICHSKKCHRPCSSSEVDRNGLVFSMYDNICLDMRS